MQSLKGISYLPFKKHPKFIDISNFFSSEQKMFGSASLRKNTSAIKTVQESNSESFWIEWNSELLISVEGLWLIAVRWLTKGALTLSACLRQSILLIFPFWSGFERTHMAGFLPVMERTKSSRHSWAMSFRNLPNSREAHFCLTSGFSAYEKNIVLIYREKLCWPSASLVPSINSGS